jgi:Tfp pilus assembly protein PilF
MNQRRACRSILMLVVFVCLAAGTPQGIFAQSKTGMELFNAWKLQEAEKVFREALKADPKDTRATSILAFVFFFRRSTTMPWMYS